MAYHAGRHRTLLFGGATERDVLGDLWAWDGKKWTCLAENGPPPRTFPSLAYDSDREELILFGGNRVLFGTDSDSSTFLDDMWRWDGDDWTQIHVQTPPARAEAAMTYDSRRDRIVLFGGYSGKGDARMRFADTWEWNGTAWMRIETDRQPSARNGAAMAFDEHRQRTVLFGGSGAPEETWEWNGTMWHHVTRANTEGRFNSAMAYDADRKHMIRFGGWIDGDRVDDTWTYDGRAWTRVTVTGPSKRNHSDMVYDGARERIVLFGGHDGPRVLGDTWEWNGEKWEMVLSHPPLERVNNGH